MNRGLQTWRPWGVWLGLFVLSLTLFLVDQRALLRYDRTALAGGELWRLFSGHVLHLNWPHFWLNMGGVLIVALFFRKDASPWQWLALILFSCVLISAGLYVFDPTMHWYMGLSGVLHALFIAGGWYERRRHVWSGNVLLLLLVGKVVMEQFGGGLQSSEELIGARVAVNAHFFGVVAGVLFVLYGEWRRRVSGGSGRAHTG